MLKTKYKLVCSAKTLVVITAVFLMLSCSTTRMYSGPELPASQTVLIRGVDSTINLVSCDGKKFSSSDVIVLPGEHTIEMSFSGGGNYSTDTTLLKFKGEAGHIYLVDKDLNAQPGRYAPVVMDKTTGKQVSTQFVPQLSSEQRLVVTEKSIKENPRHADFWVEKAGLLSGMKRYEEALQAIETALSLKPDLGGSTWNLKSFILYQLGRYDEALADIEKAIKLRGNDNDRKGKDTVLKKIEERKTTGK